MTYVAAHGYRKLTGLSSHPMADSNGEVYEHRYVAAQKLGRLLAPGEVVHHVNGDKLDNRPENLEVCASQREHLHNHRRTHCPRGHEMVEANVYYRPDNGKRMCRACIEIRWRSKLVGQKVAA